MRPLPFAIAAMAVVAVLPVTARAQDSLAACPAVDSAVKGSITPHSYLLGRYDPVADTTHLEGGGTEPRIHIDLRLDFSGAQSAAPRLGILDVLLGDPYVESARLAPDSTKLVLLVDDSIKVRTYVTGRVYRRMDPYPITLQGALSPRGFTALLGATTATLAYGTDTVPVNPEVIEGLQRLARALRCAPQGIPASR
ncbi:MAG: hypothetical protein ABJC74_14220 [Gemmatimonadota bacterium]